MRSIALLGDRSSPPSRQEVDALTARPHNELAVGATWLATATATEAPDHDGVWLVPASPYVEDGAVYLAIHLACVSGQPFLGTSGGLQYVVVDSLRHLVGTSASHTESDGPAGDDAVVQLSCRAQGQPRPVTLTPTHGPPPWVPGACTGMPFCSYPSTAGVQQ